MVIYRISLWKVQQSIRTCNVLWKNHLCFETTFTQTHDTLIFSYSQKQLQYCKKYEKNLWAYFLEENKWYDNSPKVLSQFLNDGPFTAAISKECPPRIAMYLAYKIVDSYMTKKRM
jgi:hypothetical protein